MMEFEMVDVDFWFVQGNAIQIHESLLMAIITNRSCFQHYTQTVHVICILFDVFSSWHGESMDMGCGITRHWVV